MVSGTPQRENNSKTITMDLPQGYLDGCAIGETKRGVNSHVFGIQTKLQQNTGAD